MNYAVLKNVNGNFSIDSEWNNNLNGAIVKFHDVCKTLWNTAEVQTATVEIVNEQYEVEPGYKEFIHHKTEQA